MDKDVSPTTLINTHPKTLLNYKEYLTIFGPFPSDKHYDTNSTESVDT
jgi:hypothetical protein